MGCPRELEHHVKNCLETVGAINLTLANAKIGNDDRIWLPDMNGKEDIALCDSAEVLCTVSLTEK